MDEDRGYTPEELTEMADKFLAEHDYCPPEPVKKHGIYYRDSYTGKYMRLCSKSSPPIIKDLVGVLKPRAVYSLALRHGLVDGEAHSLMEVSKKLNISMSELLKDLNDLRSAKRGLRFSGSRSKKLYEFLHSQDDD